MLMYVSKTWILEFQKGIMSSSKKKKKKKGIMSSIHHSWNSIELQTSNIYTKCSISLKLL